MTINSTLQWHLLYTDAINDLHCRPSKKSLQECIANWSGAQNFAYGREIASELLQKLLDKDEAKEKQQKESVKVQQVSCI